MRYLQYLIPMVFLGFAMGCATQPGTDNGAGTGTGTGTGASAGSVAVDSGVTTGRLSDDGAQLGTPIPGDRALNLADERIIYFAFDSAVIRTADRELIRLHGRNLADNPNLRMRLEGHADERGSREYNIGLGERRAQSVKAALMVQGVSTDQLTTVSYGEERPAMLGSNESAWEKNRRLEMVYGQ